MAPDLNAKILLVEDDEAIATMVEYNLQKEGFTVLKTIDGEEALVMMEEHRPDLVLLDWMLPSVSGIEVCRRIRANQETANTPVIMVSAKGEEADKVQGLDYGADDYITKPFSPKELIARIKAVLRRIRPAFAEQELEVGDLKMDLSCHKVSRGGTPLKLGPTEFKMLRTFMENPKRVFSREQLLDIVWGNDIYVEIRTVDVHIRRLRKAISLNDTLPDVIRTVRSAGYSLDISE